MWDYKKDTQKDKHTKGNQFSNWGKAIKTIIEQNIRAQNKRGEKARVSCSIPYLRPSSLMSSTMSSYSSSSLSSSAVTTCVKHTTFVGRAPPTWYTSFCPQRLQSEIETIIQTSWLHKRCLFICQIKFKLKGLLVPAFAPVDVPASGCFPALA